MKTSDLPYSLVIESTEDPNFFGFYSPDLQGFTGVGSSVSDCISQARLGFDEHVELMTRLGLSVPPKNRRSNLMIES
jgi:predicted RNase H-like HicB family nuclease